MIHAVVTVVLSKEYKRNDQVMVIVLDKVAQPVLQHDKPKSLLTPGAHGTGPKTLMREMYIGIECKLDKVEDKEAYAPVGGQPYFFMPEQITYINELPPIK